MKLFHAISQVWQYFCWFKRLSIKILILFAGASDRVTAANVSYVQDFVANLLRTAFPHLTDNQIKITVTGLFNLDQDIPAFKEHLRDFLVQVRNYLYSLLLTLWYQIQDTAREKHWNCLKLYFFIAECLILVCFILEGQNVRNFPYPVRIRWSYIHIFT